MVASSNRQESIFTPELTHGEHGAFAAYRNTNFDAIFPADSDPTAFIRATSVAANSIWLVS
jgi:hypothetical protein